MELSEIEITLKPPASKVKRKRGKVVIADQDYVWGNHFKVSMERQISQDTSLFYVTPEPLC